MRGEIERGRGKRRKNEGEEKLGFGGKKDKIIWQLGVSCAAHATRPRGARVRVGALPGKGARSRRSRGRVTHVTLLARVQPRSSTTLCSIYFSCQNWVT